MFLIDKYNDEINKIIYNNELINKIIKTFSPSELINRKIKNIEDFNNISYKIKNIISEVSKYSNLQHLIINGKEGCRKDYVIQILLENIFGKKDPWRATS